jgi:hypothetical protein
MFLEPIPRQPTISASLRARANLTIPPSTRWTTTSTTKTSKSTTTLTTSTTSTTSITLATKTTIFARKFPRFVCWKFSLRLSLTKLFCLRRQFSNNSCARSTATVHCPAHLVSSVQPQVIYGRMS